MDKAFNELNNNPTKEDDDVSFYTDVVNSSDKSKELLLLEIGCGVGNAFYPLLEANRHLRVYGCDFATSAISLCRTNPLYDEKRVTVWVVSYVSSINLLKK